jgi:hypothetical protein
MVKMLLIFLILTVCIAVGIKVWRSLTSSEKMSMVKLVGYSAVCALIAVGLLTLIVVLF